LICTHAIIQLVRFIRNRFTSNARPDSEPRSNVCGDHYRSRSGRRRSQPLFAAAWSCSFAGSGNFTLPWTILGIPTYSLLRALGVFKITRDSWLGRLMFSKLLKQGEPATPPSPRRLCKRYGVRRVGRVSAASRTEIRCDDGQVVLAPDLSVGWCTGFRASDDFLDVYEFANRYDC